MRGKQTSARAPPERRLAALLAAGIDGGSLPPRDEAEALRQLSHLRSAIHRAGGTIFSFAGNGLMAEFTSATEALRCALRFQASRTGPMHDPAEGIRFRIGVNAGEILAGDRHMGGGAINLVAGLERIAPPGGIALPAALHDQIRHSVPVPAYSTDQPDLHSQAEAIVVVSIAPDACLAWAGDFRAAQKSVQPRQAGDPRPILAIVPFRDAGTDDSYARSATGGVIRSLGGIATWVAVTRTPAAAVHAPIDPHRIRQISGARYILHGSAENERGMQRLTVELNEAETGRVLWSGQFDRVPGHQPAPRDDAAARIARAIPPFLLQRELDRSALAPPD